MLAFCHGYKRSIWDRSVASSFKPYKISSADNPGGKFEEPTSAALLNERLEAGILQRFEPVSRAIDLTIFHIAHSKSLFPWVDTVLIMDAILIRLTGSSYVLESSLLQSTRVGGKAVLTACLLSAHSHCPKPIQTAEHGSFAYTAKGVTHVFGSQLYRLRLA